MADQELLFSIFTNPGTWKMTTKLNNSKLKIGESKDFFFPIKGKNLLLCGHRKHTTDKPQIISLLQWLAVIKHLTCNRDTSFSNSLCRARWESAAGENVKAGSKVTIVGKQSKKHKDAQKPKPWPLPLYTSSGSTAHVHNLTYRISCPCTAGFL